MLRLLLLFFLFYCGSSIFSQDPAFFNIGREELRNTNIYSIYLDEELDLLYITTNEGAYIYKHGFFEKIPTTEAEIGSSFSNLKKHSVSGRIFCSNFNGQVFNLIGVSLKVYFEDK